MGCCNNYQPPLPPSASGVNPPPCPGPMGAPCCPYKPALPPVPPVKPGICALPCNQCVFRRIIIPATMGDHTTVPPETLEYRNVILEYEADSYVYIYSSDGIPTLISNGTGTNFNNLTNRPMYNGQAMTGLTNIPEVPTSISQLSDAARIVCIESTNQSLAQSYKVMNAAITNLTQTVDSQGDKLINLENEITRIDCDKQDKLVSGQNIKTVNGLSLLGEGNVEITLDSAGVQPLLVSGENIKTINGESILGAGDLEINLPPSYELPEIIAGGNPVSGNLFSVIGNIDGSKKIQIAAMKPATQETFENSFVLPVASSQESGLMTKEDKVKLDSLDPTEISALGGRLDTAENTITELQNYADKTVQTDTKLGEDLSSTVTLIKTTDSLASSQPTDTEIPLPVASATQAGVMNTEMYEQLQDATNKIQIILGNSTVVPTLPENPTDEQISDAYKEATGQTEVPNGAKLTGPDGKTYIYNAATQKWETFSEGTGPVEIKPFTNDAAGSIIGNDVDGGVVSDGGKGLVKGWDTAKGDIANNAAAIATAQGDITALQNRMATVEGNVTGAETDLSELKTKVAANTAAIAANTALIGDVDTLLQKLDTGTGV